MGDRNQIGTRQDFSQRSSKAYSLTVERALAGVLCQPTSAGVSPKS